MAKNEFHNLLLPSRLAHLHNTSPRLPRIVIIGIERTEKRGRSKLMQDKANKMRPTRGMHNFFIVKCDVKQCVRDDGTDWNYQFSPSVRFFAPARFLVGCLFGI